jgi:hypothetical protein
MVRYAAIMFHIFSPFPPGLKTWFENTGSNLFFQPSTVRYAKVWHKNMTVKRYDFLPKLVGYLWEINKDSSVILHPFTAPKSGFYSHLRSITGEVCRNNSMGKKCWFSTAIGPLLAIYKQDLIRNLFTHVHGSKIGILHPLTVRCGWGLLLPLATGDSIFFNAQHIGWTIRPWFMVQISNTLMVVLIPHNILSHIPVLDDNTFSSWYRVCNKFNDCNSNNYVTLSHMTSDLI